MKGRRSMTSAPGRDPLADHLLTPEARRCCSPTTSLRSWPGSAGWTVTCWSNAVSAARAVKTFDVPVVHSTVNATDRGQPTLSTSPAVH
jgi:hypothetical protein